MSHSISVFLINESDLREEKIDSILNDQEIEGDEFNWKRLGHGIMVYPDAEHPDDMVLDPVKFSKNQTKLGRKVVHISTDYFGGMGDQVAKMWINGEKVYSKRDSIGPINFVLKQLGVKRTKDEDEFDTLGLRKFRDNYNFHKL